MFWSPWPPERSAHQKVLLINKENRKQLGPGVFGGDCRLQRVRGTSSQLAEVVFRGCQFGMPVDIWLGYQIPCF
jgi:hypothetical protein